MEATPKSPVIQVEEEAPPRGSVTVSGAFEVSGTVEHRRSTEVVIEIVGVVPEKGRESSASECSVEVDLDLGLDLDLDLDLDRPVQENKFHEGKAERDCRICHLSLGGTNHESGIPIELGCSCKNDLAAAHKHCAETWFKIKGNKVCEICGSIARNVTEVNAPDSAEYQSIASNEAIMVAVAPAGHVRRFWHGHRFLNVLLATMVFAFVISWLFHFNVPS